MRRDGSHFFTTSYPPTPPTPPPNWRSAPLFSSSWKKKKKIVAFAGWIFAYTSASQFVPPPHAALHTRSICPFIIWLVLFFDRSASKANTAPLVVPLITQMAGKMMVRDASVLSGSESHLLPAPRHPEPLRALFEADRMHSKREKLLDRHVVAPPERDYDLQMFLIYLSS